MLAATDSAEAAMEDQQAHINDLVIRVSDPGFFQIPDPGICTSNGEIFSNVYEMNVLDVIKRHIFCFYTFVVRRPLKVPEPRIRSEFFPGSGALALTEDISHQKYKNKKGVL